MKEPTLKSRTARGFLWGAVNNVSMQLLNAVFGIILARNLSQDDYGLVGMLVVFTAIASSLQESGFVSALTNKRDASHRDFNSVFWFNITVSALLYLLFFLAAPLVARFYHEPLLTPLFRYFSLGFFAASFSIVPRAILFKQIRQKELAAVTIAALAVSGLTGIALVYAGCAYWGLATQSIVYTTLVALLSWRLSGWRPSRDVSWKPIREMFGFSSRMLLTSIFNQVNQNLFSIVLGRFYTKAEVGLYNQANKWSTMGSQTINGMVQGVAQPTFVEVGDDPERLRRALSKMLRFTAFVSFPSMLGLALVARELIVVLLTDRWLPSAQLMQLIALAGAFLPIATLFQNLVVSRGKSSIFMWSTIAQGLTILASVLAIHYAGGGITQMVQAYVGIVVLWVGVWNYFVWREIRFSILQTLKDTIPFLLLAAAAIGATWALTKEIENLYLLLASRVTVAAGLYFAAVWLSGAKIMRESVEFLKRKRG